MDIEYYQSILDVGFNVIPIQANKVPIQKWKEYQDEKVISIDQFRNKTGHYALVCGFNDVECIDIDLKVLNSKLERENFAKEFFDFIDSNIEDYKSKLVIKRTLNNGYHVIYQANNIEGNKKLATLKGQTEAIIETRGIGGYIKIYPEKIINDYVNIKRITDEEREILIEICRSFNEDLQQEKKPDYKTQRDFNSLNNTGLTPWDDFNSKVRVFDLISNEFTVVKDYYKKTSIKRNGAKSTHSGYIFKDSNKMYLFSTGTSYSHQQTYSPFAIYAHQNHNGDIQKAVVDLYNQGYGDRSRPEKPKELKKVKIEEPIKPKKDIEFPIDIFPIEIQKYISECARTLSSSVDYMGCALLWCASLIVGNTFKLKVKNNWTEISTLWLAIVGDAGIGKTPSIKNITFPLEELNAIEIERYQEKKKLYDEYISLPKKEKDNTMEVDEPMKTQFIVDDVTIEALIKLHHQNQNGVGILKDELAGWFKDMNKYREGSDKERWLSSWSGQGIYVDRISRQSEYIKSPILPVFGGIQPGILTSFITDENSDSGFLDRILFSYPNLTVEKYVDDEIAPELIDYYREWIVSVFQAVRRTITYDQKGRIETHECSWTPQAKREWMRIYNEITGSQNSDETSEFLKTMLPKQKGYIPRFSLILNTLTACHEGDTLTKISKKSILDAERLSKYFVAMNEKMIILKNEYRRQNEMITESKGDNYAAIVKMYTDNKNFNRSNAAKKLQISRQTIQRYINEITK